MIGESILSRTNNEVITNISSIDFYKSIYNKACNSWWVIRPTYFIFFILAVSIFIVTLGDIINYKILKTKEIIDWSDVILFFIIGLLLCFPFVICLCINIKNKGRSASYLNYLKNVKSERKLDNKDLDDLIKEVDVLKNKYKLERDVIGSHLLKIAKLVVFPFSAAIISGLISNFYFLALGLIFAICPIISVAILAWTDFRAFENIKKLGIKNYYLVSVVKIELVYMKKI
ncbi:hypothetical protein IV75_GL001325 [Carnobacterium maltaromaticum]|nr:hypothetical protein IV75_GL001325 [Carnobacterium maltaromaticum]